MPVADAAGEGGEVRVVLTAVDPRVAEPHRVAVSGVSAVGGVAHVVDAEGCLGGEEGDEQDQEDGYGRPADAGTAACSSGRLGFAFGVPVPTRTACAAFVVGCGWPRWPVLAVGGFRFGASRFDASRFGASQFGVSRFGASRFGVSRFRVRHGVPSLWSVSGRGDRSPRLRSERGASGDDSNRCSGCGEGCAAVISVDLVPPLVTAGAALLLAGCGRVRRIRRARTRTTPGRVRTGSARPPRGP